MTDDPNAPRSTSSGIELRSSYGPDASSDSQGAEPGRFPYRRGLYPEMYRRRLWTMRQYAGYADAEESNRRYHFLLEQGITGLSVAFDLPTQIGYDSDHALARGEVGKVGVAIDSIEDMRRLLEGIPLDKVTTSMTINSTAGILLALYLAVAEEREIPWTDLGGTVQNDILKEYAARGTYVFPPQPSMSLVTDIIEFCSQNVPRWNPVSVSGYHMREAGSTAVQEVAFTLANGLAYVESAVERGLDIDSFAPRVSFFFNAHNHFLEEVAKFRAARQLWAELIEERFSPKNPRSCWLRFHAQTAGSTLTAQQPDNNVVRVAVQALAAILGGAQSLHTNSRDEALGLPTEGAARLALRTQQILAHESGSPDTADPLGGSWAVESLTDEIIQRSRAYLERIEAVGGAVAGLERGLQQGEISDAAYRHQLALERGDERVVGLNTHVDEAATSMDVLTVDPAAEREQIERLEALRARRSPAGVQESRQSLETAAAQGDNLMPPILACVRAQATVGEITDTLRQVFGEHRESSFD